MEKRGGKVYTQVIKNCSKSQILPLITGNISTDATVFTDGFVDMGLLYGKSEFAKAEGTVKSHIQGLHL